MTKHVRWEIDVDGNNPDDAARLAQAIQRRPGSTATVFDVTDEQGQTVRVDLGEDDEKDRFTCDNCGHYWTADDLKYVFPGIPGLTERIEPGGIVPAGECPQCGALVYPE